MTEAAALGRATRGAAEALTHVTDESERDDDNSLTLDSKQALNCAGISGRVGVQLTQLWRFIA